jgi:hypothetical protein
MHSNQSIFSIVASKTSIFFLSLLTVIFSILPTTDLQAADWGKTEDVFEYEGTMWNGVYVDLDGLNAVASIPNYSEAILLKNNNVLIVGSLEEGKFDDVAYSMVFSIYKELDIPKSQKKFVRFIKALFPDFQVNVVDAKTQGARHALDLTLTVSEKLGSYFMRILATKDRLFVMGTNDSNELRRLAFFDSLYIE